MTAAVPLRSDSRPPSMQKTLACTVYGVFLWPGTPLLTKLGGRFAVRPRDKVYDLVCRLHGPRAAWTPMLPTLERAAELLDRPDVEAAARCIDRLALPPLSRAGADLMQAIAARLGIEMPGVPVAPNDQAGLRPDLAAGLAEAYDGAAGAPWFLHKVTPTGDFSNTHPRLNGPPNAGWFITTSDKASPPKPADFKRFFGTLYTPLGKLATSLGLPENYLLGLSAYESGYYDDHNEALKNPFGLTHGGGQNISFSSVDAAVAYWSNQYGDQVRGATSPLDFAQRLEGMKDGAKVAGWNTYNSVNPKWAGAVANTIASVDRHKRQWISGQ